MKALKDLIAEKKNKYAGGAPPIPVRTDTRATETSATTSRVKTRKRGLGLPWNSVGADIDAIPNDGHVSWIYNWESWHPNGCRTDRFEYVAMLRTGEQRDIDNMHNCLPGVGAKVLLPINEPEIPSQANLTPRQAADLWQQRVWPAKLKTGVRLGSPSISNAPNAIAWLQEFWPLIPQEQRPEFLSVHWYGVDGYDFIRHVTACHDAFGLPVWVTEFAHQRDVVWDQKGLMKQVRQWMDGTDWVERYAWFGCSREDGNNINAASRLLDRDGKLTELGREYLFDE